MRSGTGDPRGYVHAAAVHGSPEEFLAVAVPFVEGGLRAGEPTLVGLGGPHADLLRAAVDDPGLVFLDGPGPGGAGAGGAGAGDVHGEVRLGGVRAGDLDPGDPAGRIVADRAALATPLTSGSRVRMLTEVPRPGPDTPWRRWARWESAVNRAYAHLPLSGLCAYDRRSTPAATLDEVLRAHPYLATPDGDRVPNPRYEGPGPLRGHPADPQPGPPAVDLLDPSPRALRRAVRAAARGTGLSPDRVEDLVFAASEAVTNAFAHGRPPVRCRVWPAPHRVVTEVADGGRGPTDVFAGLLPTTDTTSGGLGLWLLDQLCTDVSMHRTEAGFAIRLVVAEPEPAGRA